MKIRHNHNPGWDRPSAAVSPEYERELTRIAERAQRNYDRAQRRLERAETALARAKRRHAKDHQLADLAAVVELRRLELDKYRRLMQASAQPAANRGTRSFRPVPPTP